MAGKRERKKGPRLPGALAVLAAAVVLLTSGGPRGAAAGSPAEDAVRRLPRAKEEAFIQQAPAAEPEPGEELELEPVPEPPAEEGPTWGAVPETEAVADTYFDGAVFLGDSRTEGFSLYSGLKHGQYLYAVGATVESVFTKAAWEAEPGKKVPLLDALAGMDCERVYLMLGVNELGWTRIENFHDQYAKVIDRIREDHPEADIFLQSILPVSAKQEALKTYVNNKRIREYNGVIAALAEEKSCWFLNVAEAVTDDAGCLVADWNYDGIHLNPTGCQAWLQYLRTHSVGA